MRRLKIEDLAISRRRVGNPGQRIDTATTHRGKRMDVGLSQVGPSGIGTALFLLSSVLPPAGELFPQLSKIFLP